MAIEEGEEGRGSVLPLPSTQDPLVASRMERVFFFFTSATEKRERRRRRSSHARRRRRRMEVSHAASKEGRDGGRRGGNETFSLLPPLLKKKVEHPTLQAAFPAFPAQKRSWLLCSTFVPFLSFPFAHIKRNGGRERERITSPLSFPIHCGCFTVRFFHGPYSEHGETWQQQQPCQTWGDGQT